MSALQRSAELKTESKAHTETLNRIAEVELGALARLHKIAIHYAPYLRTRADVMHEEDHGTNVQHDLDVDSLVEQEEVDRQARILASPPPDWAEDLTPKYARKKSR